MSANEPKSILGSPITALFMGLLIGSIGIYYATATFYQSKIDKDIVVAKKQIATGLACRENLAMQLSRGIEVSDGELKNCYEITQLGLEVLRKYVVEESSKEAILELIDFYQSRNKPEFSQTLNELQNLLKQTQHEK